MKNFQSHYDELKSLLRNESELDKEALRESFEIAMKKPRRIFTSLTSMMRIGMSYPR